jgi:hypothetical protein
VVPPARAADAIAGRLPGGVVLSVAFTLPLPVTVTEVAVTPVARVGESTVPAVVTPGPCGNGSDTELLAPLHAATPMERAAISTAKRFRNTANLRVRSKMKKAPLLQ